jgi:hypothetical protein
MSDGTRAPTQIMPVPRGGRALHGLGFLCYLRTRTGDITVPIAGPAGRQGHDPTLDLVYGTGDGPLGARLGLGRRDCALCCPRRPQACRW